MKTIIQISKKDFKEMSELYQNFYEIYGGDNTIWDLDQLDEMRKIGQEFMDIFAINFKKLIFSSSLNKIYIFYPTSGPVHNFSPPTR